VKLLWHVGVVDPLRLLLQTLPLYALEEGGREQKSLGVGGGRRGVHFVRGGGVIPFPF
jgi:hypothetical protein